VLGAAALVTGADQWAKALVARSIPEGSSVPILGGVFRLTQMHNRGVAFGLLPGISPILMIAAALTLVAMLSYNKGRRIWSRSSAAGFALMIGGALGNLLDRVRFGFVVDYLDLRVWPVFNLADAAIVIGAGLVLLALMRSGPDADRR
jgi:signal peptidase II